MWFQWFKIYVFLFILQFSLEVDFIELVYEYLFLGMFFVFRDDSFFDLLNQQSIDLCFLVCILGLKFVLFSILNSVEVSNVQLIFFLCMLSLIVVYFSILNSIELKQLIIFIVFVLNIVISIICLKCKVLFGKEEFGGSFIVVKERLFGYLFFLDRFFIRVEEVIFNNNIFFVRR